MYAHLNRLLEGWGEIQGREMTASSRWLTWRRPRTHTSSRPSCQASGRIRRSILIEWRTGFRIIGSRFSADTRRLRELAARNRLPHRWIDLEEDSDAEQLLRGLGIAPAETPVVIWRGEQVLRNPANAELARVFGLRPAVLSQSVYVLVVAGAGPAGLAAAVYGASEGLRTLVLDAVATGGQAGTSSRIENYLGFPSGISGAELAERAEIQAEKFGADITVPAEVTALGQRDGRHIVSLDDGTTVVGRILLIATGVHYRRLGHPEDPGRRAGQVPLRRDQRVVDRAAASRRGRQAGDVRVTADDRDARSEAATPTTTRPRRAIATFGSYREAERAVDLLSDKGFRSTGSRSSARICAWSSRSRAA
jgi:hypothetical protein